MKKLNKTAAKILDTLTQGLDAGDARKVDNRFGTFMAVHLTAAPVLGHNQLELF